MASAPASPPLLQVKDLSVVFRQAGRETLAVNHIDFSLDHQKTLALVGESGSGKSVSALSIMRLLPYPVASHPSGSILFEGQDTLRMDAKEMRSLRGRRIGMIFQEPMSALNPLHTVERQIGEMIDIHAPMKQADRRTRILQLLEKVGIPSPETRLQSYPHQLSGGQRQRVMIAMALANNPELLIADEPTTALDVTVQAQILELLADLKRDMGMAMLFITHDLGLVRKIADDVCVMRQGEIVEQGPVAQVFAAPSHDYTRMLLDAEPQGAPPVYDKNAPLVVNAEDVKVWFPVKKGIFRRTVDHIKAVDGIDVSLRKGQTVGVVGESGSGKTTLGLALLRLIGSKGTIVFQGKPIDGLKGGALRALRQNMQIVFQDPFGSLSPRMPVSDIVAEGLRLHHPHLSAQQRDERVCEVLREVELDPKTRFRYPHEFSGGQRQRISIARALILEPDFLMLDEPTSALDRSVQATVIDLLRSIQQKRNLTYLFISHDLKVVKALAHDVIVMRHGKVVESGPAEKIFSQPETEYTKTLMKAAFEMEAA
jgi:microcin C transport system ATP-binding protein